MGAAVVGSLLDDLEQRVRANTPQKWPDTFRAVLSELRAIAYPSDPNSKSPSRSASRIIHQSRETQRARIVLPHIENTLDLMMNDQDNSDIALDEIASAQAAWRGETQAEAEGELS
jgi:hypothetical protein